MALIAIDYNLDSIIEETKEWWLLPSKTFFHHAIAQYITQMISFKQSRVIRRKLYEFLGDPYNKNLFDSIPYNKLLNIGINNDQIIKLREISHNIIETDSHQDNLLRLSYILGIGPWTIKSIQLMLRSEGYESMILFEDAYIRNRLKELCEKDNITPSLANKLIQQLANNSKNVGAYSLFLWRITPEGIQNLKLQKRLQETDFISK
jgi:3-methyladenine DNA glycosylase/8-oxoguanine DNA glycosylase